MDKKEKKIKRSILCIRQAGLNIIPMVSRASESGASASVVVTKRVKSEGIARFPWLQGKDWTAAHRHVQSIQDPCDSGAVHWYITN